MEQPKRQGRGARGPGRPAGRRRVDAPGEPKLTARLKNAKLQAAGVPRGHRLRPRPRADEGGGAGPGHLALGGRATRTSCSPGPPAWQELPGLRARTEGVPRRLLASCTAAPRGSSTSWRRLAPTARTRTCCAGSPRPRCSSSMTSAWSRWAPPQRKELLEVLDDRYQLGSTVVTSQLEPKDWHAVIGDADPGRRHLRPARPQRPPPQARRRVHPQGGRSLTEGQEAGEVGTSQRRHAPTDRHAPERVIGLSRNE